jgi:hypothetical protein
VIAFVAMLVLAPAIAYASFPGSNPNESVRINTPNDPRFDRCELDNEEGPPTCSNTFDQQFERFGFAPGGSQSTAIYHDPFDPHVVRYSGQNTTAGRFPLGQVPGVSADRAWKYSTGTPSVQVAILDTGIRWNNGGLRAKVALNRDELPLPQHANGSTCAAYDCNGDGAFNVDDYADDPRVLENAGHTESDSILDASDLIGTFSNSNDADSNGYVDDIAGWDFFDDDNNPYDASSYSSASNHGTGRAEEAGEQGNDGSDGIGVCPRCQVVPMRIWDTFVADSNNFAMAALYAADNDIEVVEGAIGALFNSSFARAAFDYAYQHGVFFTIVSSDLNTGNHNIPTLYDEAMQVQGTVSDVHGLGQNPPQQFIDFFNGLGVPLGTNAPIQTWYRNSGTTQYGGHAHITMPAVTGSAATGQASGAAGLVISYARQLGVTLEPNEVKQLLTMTAFDVTAPDTAGLGVPDPALEGWDQHFGYGVPDLGLALERLDQSLTPPRAFISSPEWFVPYNTENEEFVPIKARLGARTPTYDWRLEWAPGIEPAESEYQVVSTGSESGPIDATLGTINLGQVRAALDNRVGGGATTDPTAPAKGPGDKDPNEPAFTVRVVVIDESSQHGEDRKMLFAYRDETERYKKPLGSGGEASQRMFDLDGDNKLDTVLADSSGELHVLNADGSPLQSFNGGQPVQTQLYPNVHAGAPPFGSVDPPREVLRTPAIGDIDGDLEPEIVDTAGEHVYAWEADGATVSGFPVRLDPALSLPQNRTRTNHIKRGFTASPTLGDLDADGSLDIVAPALDQHVYAWDGSGNPMPGFPKKLSDTDGNGNPLDGAEIITTAALGNLTGDSKPEIVTPTQEFDDNPSAPATPGSGAVGGFGNILTNILANVLGGSGRVYALDGAANPLTGWPTNPNGVVPDALPLVGPGVDHVLANVDTDPELEVIGNLATGDVTATNSNGTNQVTYDSEPAGGEHIDKSKVLNLFENPIAADIDGVPGPEIIKGGVTLNQLVNIGVGVGQNLPYNHVVQAWNAQTGASLPSFPQAVEDFQLLSSPTVADVSDAPGKEIIVGTGMYYLRNISATGVEGTGWPKFTGGWLFSTPAVGDTDNDGDLDVTALTREGYAFSWGTDRATCGGNDEWWTSRHDEWNTGAYGTDTRPPGTPYNLHFNLIGSHVVTLAWNAPGDDWLCGTGDKFRILKSTTPIDDPSDGTVVGDFDATAAAGGTESKLITNINTENQFFAVLYQDEAGNWGHLQSIGLPYARPGSGTPLRVPLVTEYRQCTSANSTHAQPLSNPSCTPAVEESQLLTTSKIGRGGGFAKLRVVPGNPNTTTDEADVEITASMSDVRKSDNTDYTGQVVLRSLVRMTDTNNGVDGGVPATVQDWQFSVPITCVGTAAPPTVGSDCDVTTTLDTLVPDALPEGARTLISAFSVNLTDAGVDNSLTPPSDPFGLGCPPTCGSGDEKVFARQGVFAP